MGETIEVATRYRLAGNWKGWDIFESEETVFVDRQQAHLTWARNEHGALSGLFVKVVDLFAEITRIMEAF